MAPAAGAGLRRLGILGVVQECQPWGHIPSERDRGFCLWQPWLFSSRWSQINLGKRDFDGI